MLLEVDTTQGKSKCIRRIKIYWFQFECVIKIKTYTYFVERIVFNTHIEVFLAECVCFFP